MWSRRLPRTSGLCALERRDSDTKDLHSTGSSLASCARVETSHEVSTSNIVPQKFNFKGHL